MRGLAADLGINIRKYQTITDIYRHTMVHKGLMPIARHPATAVPHKNLAKKSRKNAAAA